LKHFAGGLSVPEGIKHPASAMVWFIKYIYV